MRKPFLFCWKRHTPLVYKICVREIFSLFYIISTQRSYIYQNLDTNSCYAKLRAISNLLSTLCIIESTLILHEADSDQLALYIVKFEITNETKGAVIINAGGARKIFLNSW